MSKASASQSCLNPLLPHQLMYQEGMNSGGNGTDSHNIWGMAVVKEKEVNSHMEADKWQRRTLPWGQVPSLLLRSRCLLSLFIVCLSFFIPWVNTFSICHGHLLYLIWNIILFLLFKLISMSWAVASQLATAQRKHACNGGMTATDGEIVSRHKSEFLSIASRKTSPSR